MKMYDEIKKISNALFPSELTLSRGGGYFTGVKKIICFNGTQISVQLCDCVITVYGVGLKVASCALLFGFEKTEAFPIDVWMRRALDNHFGGSIDLVALGATAGIAQQYLFYYEKYNQTLD
jgi:hypothetical protein